MESVSPTVPLMPPPSAPHLLLQERIPSSFAVRRSCCFVSLALPPKSQPERRSPYPEIRFDLRRRSVGPVALRTEGGEGVREEADWSEHSLCPPDRLRLLD